MKVFVGWVERHKGVYSLAREDVRLRPDVFAGYGETHPTSRAGAILPA
jgi:hypothetical protein